MKVHYKINSIRIFWNIFNIYVFVYNNNISDHTIELLQKYRNWYIKILQYYIISLYYGNMCN